MVVTTYTDGLEHAHTHERLFFFFPSCLELVLLGSRVSFPPLSSLFFLLCPLNPPLPSSTIYTIYSPTTLLPVSRTYPTHARADRHTDRPVHLHAHSHTRFHGKHSAIFTVCESSPCNNNNVTTRRETVKLFKISFRTLFFYFILVGFSFCLFLSIFKSLFWFSFFSCLFFFFLFLSFVSSCIQILGKIDWFSHGKERRSSNRNDWV